MSVFDFYIDRAETYEVQGKSPELIFVTRRGRTESSSVMNNDKQGLLQDDTTIVTGDLVTKGTLSYFVQGRQSSTEANSCQLRKVNATLVIQRLAKHFTSGVFDNTYMVTQALTVPSSYKEVTGTMKQWDQGLLGTTTIRFMTQVIDVKLTDRIVFNGTNYIVNFIDTAKYEGLYDIQCSPDIGRTVK
jgi:hypothetical protein